MIRTFIRAADGSIFLNDQKRFAKGCLLVPRTGSNPMTLAALATSPPLAVEGPQDAIAEIFSLVGRFGASDDATAQARLTVRISDLAWRRDLMNRPIPVSHVFGGTNQASPNGSRPYRLPKTIILDSQQILLFEFKNNDAQNATNFAFACEGRKFQKFSSGLALAKAFQADQYPKCAYLYPYWLAPRTDISLAAGASQTVFYENTSDQLLVLNKILASAIIGAGTPAGNERAEVFEVTFYDAKTQRKLMNQPMTMNEVSGTAQYPFLLDPPLIVEPKTTIQADFKNLDTGAAYEIWLTFAGVACYSGAALDTPEMLNQPEAASLIPSGLAVR